MNVKTVDSSQLETGDIVLTYGMRVKLGERATYYSNGTGKEVFHFDGQVLNLDEVIAAGLVPPSWLRTEKWAEGRGWVTDREDYWVIQGNDDAQWQVERTEVELEA